MLDDWQKAAEKSNMSTSAFIQHIVNSYFENGISVSSQKRYEKQIKELHDTQKQLQKENIELSKKVMMLNTLTDRYEVELQHLRNENFNTASFDGERHFNKELVSLLRDKKHVKEHELLPLLHVDPADTETTKAIHKQLESLLDSGVIKMYRGGYQWQE